MSSALRKMKAPRACPIHTQIPCPSPHQLSSPRANFARERSSVSRRTQFTGAQKQPHFLGGSGSGSGADIIGTFTFGTCEQTHGAGTSEGRDGGGLARCGGAGAPYVRHTAKVVQNKGQKKGTLRHG